MVNLPKMRLGPESAAWGRAIEKLLLDTKKTAQHHDSQIAANNRQNIAALSAGAVTNQTITEIGADILAGRALPAQPLNLTATSVGGWDASGTAVGNIIVNWTMPLDPTYSDPSQYEVWWKPSAALDTAYIRLGASAIQSFTAETLAPGLIMAVRVRAVTAFGMVGAFSDSTVVTIASPVNNLLAPSAPTLTSETGVIVVTWDGKLADGSIAPVQVGFARAFISATSTGTYIASGQTIQAGGNIVISGQTVGTTRWVKLGLTDNLGRVTLLSVAASVVVQGLADSALSADSINVWPFKTATIPSGAFKPGAVGGGDIANFAITALKYNDTRHHIF